MNRSDKPGFDEPDYTVDPAVVFRDRSTGLGAAAPLSELGDPEGPLVTTPSAEPLVPVVHRRVRTLANYWHAGWDHAIAGCWLRTGAFERLGAVADALPQRWGLAVFDAWRPLALQQELFDTAYSDPDLPPGFMAPVSDDPATPPPHLTGGTVDLTLTYDGSPLALGTGFDDLTELAHTTCFESEPGIVRDLRRYLVAAMAQQGFSVLHCEWWHFEYGTRRWAALTGAEPLYGPASPPASESDQ